MNFFPSLVGDTRILDEGRKISDEIQLAFFNRLSDAYASRSSWYDVYTRRLEARALPRSFQVRLFTPFIQP